MKHIIIGGDGFVGRHLAVDLAERGESVIVADIVKSPLDIYKDVTFLPLDVTDLAAVRNLPIAADDVIYNLSAKMLSPIQVKSKRHDFFWPVNYYGTFNILEAMLSAGASKLVHFSTDMVYGRAIDTPQTEEHPVAPLGEYGMSKLVSEELAAKYRDLGIDTTIFRPRLIIGPGRLGVLVKLFGLIDRNLPVPIIGNGRHPYQFISVFDCARAAVAAWKSGFPNEAYNLGSDNPPTVRELLARLIREAKSRSIMFSTPASLVKLVLSALDRVNMPVLDPEQYLIANEHCVLDTTKAKSQLAWRPLDNDTDMLLAAYRTYSARRISTAQPSVAMHAE